LGALQRRRRGIPHLLERDFGVLLVGHIDLIDALGIQPNDTHRVGAGTLGERAQQFGFELTLPISPGPIARNCGDRLALHRAEFARPEAIDSHLLFHGDIGLSQPRHTDHTGSP